MDIPKLPQTGSLKDLQTYLQYGLIKEDLLVQCY